MKDEKEYSNEREYFQSRYRVESDSAVRYSTVHFRTLLALYCSFNINIVCLSNILQKFILSWNTIIEQYSGIFTTEEKVFHSTVL